MQALAHLAELYDGKDAVTVLWFATRSLRPGGAWHRLTWISIFLSSLNACVKLAALQQPEVALHHSLAGADR